MNKIKNKLLLGIILGIIMFSKSVNAQEIYYQNDLGVTLSKKEYEFISNIYMKDGKTILEKNTKIKTMDTVYNNILLFHNQGKIFEIFCEEKLSIKMFKVNKKDFYPQIFSFK